MKTDDNFNLIIVVTFLLLYLVYIALQSSACEKHGGVLVQGAGWYKCVKGIK